MRVDAGEHRVVRTRVGLQPEKITLDQSPIKKASSVNDTEQTERFHLHPAASVPASTDGREGAGRRDACALQAISVANIGIVPPLLTDAGHRAMPRDEGHVVA